MEEIDNSKIAMSLLRQCAWVWEHCTRNTNDGEFKLSEVMQGMYGRNRYQSKPGIVMTTMEMCKYWDLFVPKFSQEGLVGFDRKSGEVSMKFGTFRFSYKLDIVFVVTARFCKYNCPSMANKVRFWCKDGERGAFLPGLPKAKATKPKTTKPKATTKPMPTVKPLSLSEQLRKALLARMAA